MFLTWDYHTSVIVPVLFADDTIVYLTISSLDDCHTLQPTYINWNNGSKNGLCPLIQTNVKSSTFIQENINQSSIINTYYMIIF